MKWFQAWDFDGNEYKVFRPIIWGVVLITVALILNIFIADNFSGQMHGYSYCPENAMGGKCYNDFYQSNICGQDRTVFWFFTQKGLDNSSALCTTEIMLAGESLGDPEPFLVSYVWYIVVALLVIGIVSNHLLFNVGYRKNVSVQAENSATKVGGEIKPVINKNNESGGIGGAL